MNTFRKFVLDRRTSTVVPDAGELLARKDFQPLLDEGLAALRPDRDR